MGVRPLGADDFYFAVIMCLGIIMIFGLIKQLGIVMLIFIISQMNV